MSYFASRSNILVSRCFSEKLFRLTNDDGGCCKVCNSAPWHYYTFWVSQQLIAQCTSTCSVVFVTENNSTPCSVGYFPERMWSDTVSRSRRNVILWVKKIFVHLIHFGINFHNGEKYFPKCFHRSKYCFYFVYIDILWVTLQQHFPFSNII